MIPDPALRATAFTPVLAMVKKLPDALVTQLSEGGTRARYVRISLPGRATLTLAEVEVMSEGKNIAPGGQASQSSTGYGGEASRAIDGNTNGDYSAGGQTHTNENQENTWWELDLKGAYPIDAIRIWNRTDGNGGYISRLDHFTLTLLDSERKEIASVKDQPAPRENVEITMQGDPIGSIRRAAISALASINEQPKTVFNTFAEMVAAGDELPSAAAAILTVPRADWEAAPAKPAVAKLLAWAGDTPADQRTSQQFIETMQVANQLATLFPANEAAELMKKLRDFRVSVFVLKTVREEMRYDTPRLVVEAGKPFEVIFENADMMPHNILFVQPGTRQAIAESVQTMPPNKLDNQGRAYIPENDQRVFGASRLLEPGQRETLKLTAPAEEGEYEYVCTFPGHWVIMWGKLVVTKDVDAFLESERN